jgi:hypothetical protein
MAEGLFKGANGTVEIVVKVVDQCERGIQRCLPFARDRTKEVAADQVQHFME